MLHRSLQFGFLMAFCCLLLLTTGCATFEPQPIDVQSAAAQVSTQSERGVTVSTTILDDDRAAQLYGVDLAAVGLQAIWLQIENQTDHAYWLLVSALDADYYPPDEAAALFYSSLSETDEQRVTRHFRDLAIPLKSTPGSVSEGYVLAPRQEGGRYIVVALTGQGDYVHFGFAVTLPDGDFDFERLHPETIYADQERSDLNLEQLRTKLQALPCCVTDEAGEQNGDPMNLVVVGDAPDLLVSMARAGWSFTHRIDWRTIRRLLGASISGESYPVAPVSPLYFMGRQQDLALQRARNTIVQRNHLRLWLAPFRFEGSSVWVGQVSRDVSVKATTRSPSLTTHVIDPNVDEAREHLLQSLMVTGSVKRFGFVDGVGAAPPEQPRFNLTGDPYYTDGLRLLVILAGSGMIPPDEIEFLEWFNSMDPLADPASSR